MLGFTFGTVEFIIELILLAIGVFVATLVLGRRFYDDAHFTVERDETVAYVPIPYFRTRRLSLFNRDNFKVWVISLAFTLVTGLVSYFAPRAVQARTWGWGILFFILMLAAMICLTVWWRRHGDNAVDFFWMLVAMVCMARVAAASAGLMTMGIDSTWWSMFFVYISWLVPGICVIACAIAAARYWRREAGRTESEDDVRKARRWTAFAWIWTALTSLVLVLLLIFEGTILGISPSPNPQPSPVATEPATESATTENQLERDWLTYQEVVERYSYLDWDNFPLLSDGDLDNNADFGPNRYHDGWTGLDYLADMKGYEQRDLLILVAHLGTLSAATNTDMVGDYYDGNDHNWSRTMNAMVKSCLDDKTNRIHLLEVLQAFWNSGIRGVRVVHMDDVHDQMRIMPYTYEGVPKIVASETHQSGEILLLTLRTKGGPENDVTVGFRINCCYQPIGVIDLMDMPDTKVEVPEYTPGGQTPTTKPGGGSDPTPTPTPTPTTTPTPGPTTPPSSGNKNPASDPANQGNADKGGGDNRASNGGGDYQSSDPRNTDQQPSAVKPQTPAVTPDHSSDSGGIVDHQNQMDYQPDAVTDRGSTSSKPPTSSSGDGEFTPAD